LRSYHRWDENGIDYGSHVVLTLLGRMALIALVIGTAVTGSATERITASLVLAGVIGWSFVPVIQLLTGLLLVRGFAPNRTQLLGAYFATHRPWSLWILAAHAVFLLSPAARPYAFWITATAAIPMVLTVRLLQRFCRDELRLDPRRSWGRVALHQSATYTIAFAYVFVAVALWPRILGLFR
jgi:hypothetical protein